MQITGACSILKSVYKGFDMDYYMLFLIAGYDYELSGLSTDEIEFVEFVKRLRG